MPDAEEAPHFERASFRAGKKIFATMTADGEQVMVRVQPVDKCLALLASDPALFIDLGGWTRRYGSLGVRLKKADAKLLGLLVREAWAGVAPKRTRRK
jgi:hypothetical protein